MTMLSDFLKEHGISVDELVARSKALEATHIEDRKLGTKRLAARSQKKSYTELNLAKPKGLGRGVQPATVQRAMDGTILPRLLRKKITRAVNSALVSKKKEAVDWRKLFADVKARKGKSLKK